MFVNYQHMETNNLFTSADGARSDPACPSGRQVLGGVSSVKGPERLQSSDQEGHCIEDRH